MNPKKVIRTLLPAHAVTLAEEMYRKGRLKAIQAQYGFPARGLKAIAVTGTNGKTTTCLIINEMLKGAGKRTAMLTTAVVELDGMAQPNTNHRTVPLTADLMKFLKDCKEKQVDYVVLEVTSQALDQHKVAGIPIEVAVMTNLTQDHLDYHKTMQRYAEAKARLFNTYMRPKHAVLNHDDPWFDYYNQQSVAGVVSYGRHEKSGVRIFDEHIQAEGSKYRLQSHADIFSVQTPLAGEFNVYNSAAAVAVGLILGLDMKDALQGIADFRDVPGRMEKVQAGQDFTVLVDYAHTPDALQNVLGAARTMASGKVMLVFGATGDRDKAKRPVMGEVAATYADQIFLTDDETYTEDPATIRREVMSGIEKAKGQGKTTEIGDRREAIAAAFKTAKKGDVVLLAGIGHQDYRAMGGKKEPWDERQVAKELLQAQK